MLVRVAADLVGLVAVNALTLAMPWRVSSTTVLDSASRSCASRETPRILLAEEDATRIDRREASEHHER